ncbi:MAG: sensor domain-containing diguanylate cyclase [Syntrophobacterales bacterium]|nr:sensor domain-containing diguanylate cyclase [Syntrophobacterales bacterium]
MIVLGVIFLYIGIIRFFDRKINYWFIGSIYTIFILTFLYFLLIDDNIWIRGIIISFTLSIISLLTAHALFFWRPKYVASSANFSGVFFAIHGCFFMFRAILQMKDITFVHPFSLNPLNVVTYIDALFCSILWTYTLIIMINHRLNTEMKLAKEKMELIFNTSPDAAMITSLDDGTILYVNDGFISASGFTREEAIGKRTLDLEIWKSLEDREAMVSKLVRDGYLKNFEVIVRKKEGSTFHGIVSASIININDVPYMISITRDITERKMMEEQLQTMSITDELTGLYNRRGFFILGEQQLKVTERTKKPLLLFYIDLDKMKQINDEFGHKEGDQALIDVAYILKGVFRKSDVICRIGGDEFVVLGIEASNGAEDAILGRLYNMLDVFNSSRIRGYQLSLSIGIARYDPENPIELDQLLSKADENMYKQKKMKKDEISYLSA